ncbi:MAG: helix-turn-helix protein [Rhizobiaceae bacterium]|nr:helix-turn-helix protein [Rhizobiaceae bacterium]
MSDPSSNMLIRKLESVATLDAGLRSAIEALPIHVAELKTDTLLIREGDRPTRSCILMEGFVCWFKVSGEGKRQILSFHVPGDMPDMQSLHLSVMDTSLGTITPCRVAFIPHRALLDLCEQHPRISHALWRTTLIDAAVFREWVMNIGGRPAYGRIAHLLCELVVRLRAVGLTDGYSCDLPITQSEIADASGLSTVHVNRTLQDLRANRLISLKGTYLDVLDWKGLKEAGDFDPAYLHLHDRPAGLT